MNNSGGIIKNNSNKFAAVYRAIDVVLINATLFIALISYAHSYTPQYIILGISCALIFQLVAESFSLYRSWRVGKLKELTFYSIVTWAFSLGSVFVGLVLLKVSEDYSRVVLSLWAIYGAITLVSWRLFFKHTLARLRRKGFNTRTIAIFGLSEKGVRLAEETFDHPEIGYRLVAIYDDRHPDRLNSKFHKLLKGNIAEGVDAAKDDKFDVIYIALPLNAQTRIQVMLEAFGDTTATVHVVPDFFMYCLMHGEMAHVGDVQTISVYDNPMRGGYAVIKRLEDILLSIGALLILAVPMLAIAMMIKITSKGPVLFRQDRYGLNGRKIKVLKFRTMHVNEADEVIKQASKDDPRITKLGRFLRRLSLDELPQFFNVLTGQMSVIGPRPHAVSHNEQYRKLVDFYMLRHKVKPGITGWAQVNGFRGETDTIEKMKRRVEFDLEYIRNWSLWLDFKILVYTLLRSFTDKNAY